jgi:hypothetical protein
MTNTVSLKIFEKMCPQQQQDLQEMLDSLDNFSAAAFALSSSSPQAYTSFIEVRDTIRNQVQTKFMNYRLVVVA